MKLDREQSEDMKKTMGDAFPKFVEVSLTSMSTRMSDLAAAIDNQDLEATHLASHALGSTSAYFGLLDVQSIGRRIEAIAADQMEAKDKNFGEIEDLYKQLDGEYAEAKSFLQKELGA